MKNWKMGLLFFAILILVMSACGGSAWIEDYQDAMTAQAKASAQPDPTHEAIRDAFNETQLQNHMFGGDLFEGD